MIEFPRARKRSSAARPSRRDSGPKKPLSSPVRAFEWTGTVLRVLEQKDLPHKVRFLSCRTVRQTADTIRNMSVRGAPAIGCVAAFGVALAAREARNKNTVQLRTFLDEASKQLAATRPTAVNLFWALERMRVHWTQALSSGSVAPSSLWRTLAVEAEKIAREDLESCLRMGESGAALLPRNAVLLTHCNTGALATAGHGTALGIIRSAHVQGKVRKVFVDETRPYWQGARLTAWECRAEGIPHELITDSMAAHLMRAEKVSAVLVGADRIAANGDTANKIGTYALAIVAAHHRIPFYVAAPLTTVDLKTSDGSAIPIEERSQAEVLRVGSVDLAPKGTTARHPAFDVTPSGLITAIVTDRGVVRAPYRENLARLLR